MTLLGIFDNSHCNGSKPRIRTGMVPVHTTLPTHGILVCDTLNEDERGGDNQAGKLMMAGAAREADCKRD